MPIPEIVAAFVVALFVVGTRASWRAIRVAFGSRPGGLRHSPPAGTDTLGTRTRLLASCVVFAVMGIPLILGVVPPNGIYGFRTAATLSNRTIWYPANAFMGWALVLSAVVSASLLIVLPGTVKRSSLWAVFLASTCAAIVASFVYVSRLG